jgi:hypothetical protein
VIEGTKTRRFMDAFDRAVHPRTLFVVLPAGLFTYWVISSLMSNRSSHSPPEAIGAAVKKGVLKYQVEKVDAWKNPKYVCDPSFTTQTLQKAMAAIIFFNFPYMCVFVADVLSRKRRTNRWETPAPWDAEYKKYIAVQPLQKVG